MLAQKSCVVPMSHLSTWIMFFATSCLIAGLGVALPATAVTPSGPVLVLAPPWSDVERVIAQANLSVVSPVGGKISRMTQVSTPDDLARLYDSGAWLLLNETRLMALCLR